MDESESGLQWVLGLPFGTILARVLELLARTCSKFTRLGVRGVDVLWSDYHRICKLKRKTLECNCMSFIE